MRSLDRKLLRDLLRMKGQVTAIALIIACGISAFVTVLTAYQGLRRTRDAYYAEYRMADLFAPVKKAPRSVLPRLESIPGVRRVRPRIVFDVTIDLPEVAEPCFGRVVSLPDRRRKVINDIHLVRGGWFRGDGDRQVIVGDRFAREHGLSVGDHLRVIMNNRKESLRVVATALSPEYVYMVRGAGDILPDAAHFTVLWFGNSFAESVFDFRDSANDFVALLDRAVPLAGVIAAFDRVLDRYGAVGAFGRKDQLSNRYLSDEIDGLKGTATFVPAVFLAVAAFVLHMILGRLVRTQRTQIAVFRAFGHGTGELVLHYLKLALLVGAAGSAVGTGVGIWFGRSLLETYRRFYQFPLLRFSVDPVVVSSGIGVSLLFASLGAVSAVRRVARLGPAEGLRPEAPAVYRRTVIEAWPGLWRNLGVAWRMVIRNILRAKLRSALTVGGVALSAAIILLALFSDDSLRFLMNFQYHEVERQDIRVAFNRERSRRALYEIRRLPGVRTAEPTLVVPARVRHGRRTRRVGITGLEPGSRLRNLVDRNRHPVPRPRNGLVLSAKLAELLDVRPGDEVEVEALEGRKQTFRARVEATADEYLGLSAYADLHRLSRWIDEEDAMAGALLTTDPARAGALAHRLKDLPAVESVAFKEQTIRNFEDTLSASMGIMTGVLTVFAGIISFGVIYNASRIGLAERRRSLASMRVLGFSEREVSAVLTRETLLLTVIGVAPGLGLGWLQCLAMAKIYDTDLYRFPLVLRGPTLLATAAVVILFAVLANLSVRRRVRRLDLVEALKARE